LTLNNEMDQTWLLFWVPHNKNLIAATLCIALLCCVIVDITALMSNTAPEESSSRLTGSQIGKGFLVPSQVFRNRERSDWPAVAHKRRRAANSYSCLIPSQVFCASPKAGEEGRGLSPFSNETTTDSPSQGGRTGRRKKLSLQSSRQRVVQASTENIEATSCDIKTRQRDHRKNIKVPITEMQRDGRRRGRNKKVQTGDLPDVQWRSIPMEHLRRHPRFRPLPPPETIQRLEFLEDVRFFRQESWQWGALHEGRCTTSQAVAALGFLEPRAGDRLGVPKGLRRGGLGAYHRLRRPALRSLNEMNAKLCVNNLGGNGRHQAAPTAHQIKKDQKPDDSIDRNNPFWIQLDGFPFAAKYMVTVTKNERQQRRKQTAAYLQSRPGIEWSIRMIWGNAQEGTALLTALNYFWKQDANVTLEEVGMCGAGLEFNQTSSSNPVPGLIIGATPDALLRHSDGRVEALEVKNHCPFVPNAFSQEGADPTASGCGHRFRIGRQEFGTKSVLPNYIPQLMMEMLCVGDECKSAIMVRQSATSGSLVMRIHRDDEWIEEMLYWLRRFYSDFVIPREAPPQNFFFEGSHAEDRARYVRFLDWTKRIESQVELLCHVANEEIQRTFGTFPESTNFFLD
jgi:hypothetical protein